MALHEAGYPKRDNAKMNNETYSQPHQVEDVEIQEWLESLDSVLESSGPEVAAEINLRRSPLEVGATRKIVSRLCALRMRR